LLIPAALHQSCDFSKVKIVNEYTSSHEQVNLPINIKLETIILLHYLKPLLNHITNALHIYITIKQYFN